MTERRPADSHAHPVLSTEFEEPTAKLPLWRPYAPAAGATFETLAVVEARGLEFLRIDFEASSCPNSQIQLIFPTGTMDMQVNTL